MEGVLLNIAGEVLAVLIPALVALAMEYLRRKLGTEKMQKIQEELTAKQELATLAVRFVEQTYKDLHGQEKFEKAAEWLAVQAQERGLKLTTNEVKGLIEATLRRIKDAFGEEWAKVGTG